MPALPSSTTSRNSPSAGLRSLVKQVLRLDEPGTRSHVRYRGALSAARFRLPRRFSTGCAAYAQSLA
jgi:hypothetical protein